MSRREVLFQNKDVFLDKTSESFNDANPSKIKSSLENIFPSKLDEINFLKSNKQNQESRKKISKIFSQKELLDRIGYGLAGNQYLIIFLFLIGSPVFSRFIIGFQRSFFNFIFLFFKTIH